MQISFFNSLRQAAITVSYFKKYKVGFASNPDMRTRKNITLKI